MHFWPASLTKCPLQQALLYKTGKSKWSYIAGGLIWQVELVKCNYSYFKPITCMWCWCVRSDNKYKIIPDFKWKQNLLITIQKHKIKILCKRYLKYINTGYETEDCFPLFLLANFWFSRFSCHQQIVLNCSVAEQNP